ncbi:cephalosporin hydroxylase [Paenibacillus odorifer]|uniref:Cephalosporin hydroxylase n=1 Tax=Paenibacillus odorifer TaxID=189426 RepID=A0A1R0WVM2_9BACL|nr:MULTISPECIES: cephalosporin hydroxylase family protein [Paenibacillus]ETT65507.1 motility/biofilm formation protein FlhH [Paenibacillus sp. FSL H8-237]OMD22465.1 cephalosporin hydroxylase [Paenibacillus odorifer]OME44824.1 cephalosporin hydroxylase [Paenibacillus odorifer]OME59207.1 cephalosporin hydroxylase [Paenibacillus odorifer]
MNEIKKFQEEVKLNIQKMSEDQELQLLSNKWIEEISPYKYSYNFSWMGRPIIQFPQDIIALQEIIWSVRPDLIIETGVAHGGSIIFHASMLELLGGDGEVIGIDIDIRKHNRLEIENHPMYKRIKLLEGSSTDEGLINKVKEIAKDKKNIMVILDSSHTHQHVLEELKLYSSLVTKGSYIVVLDTIIEDMPEDSFPDRPWGKGDNPKTAVWEFLVNNDRFEIDKAIQHKLLLTVAPDGYLKCVED